MNRNQESIEQLKRLTQSAKNFYGNNYSPGFISHKNDVKHYLGEEYIPYDWGDDIDSPANDEYKKVYMNKSPNYNFSQKPQTQNLMQTPKPMQQTTQFQAPKPQTMKTPTLSTSLMPKQKLKGFGDYMVDYKEIANKIWDSALGDITYGANRTINGLTGGALDYLGSKYNIDTQMNGYLSQKPQEERMLTSGLGDLAQVGGTYLTTKSLFGAIPALSNYITRCNGRTNLVNQLKKGSDFKDINFGRIDKDTLYKINELRKYGGLDELSGNAYIPANVVKKFYNKRLKEGYTPEGLSDMGKRLFHEKGSEVTESKHSHIQEVSKARNNFSEKGYVSQEPTTGRFVIKSMYKK